MYFLGLIVGVEPYHLFAKERITAPNNKIIKPISKDINILPRMKLLSWLKMFKMSFIRITPHIFVLHPV